MHSNQHEQAAGQVDRMFDLERQFEFACFANSQPAPSITLTPYMENLRRSNTVSPVFLALGPWLESFSQGLTRES
jgi:hypothetical protein